MNSIATSLEAEVQLDALIAFVRWNEVMTYVEVVWLIILSLLVIALLVKRA